MNIGFLNHFIYLFQIYFVYENIVSNTCLLGYSNINGLIVIQPDKTLSLINNTQNCMYNIIILYKTDYICC